jgi:hypothetical protein
MPTFTKHTFNGATHGFPQDIGATGSAGTLVHTVGATATTGTEFDSIYLFLTNSSAQSQLCTIEFGGTATEYHIPVTVPSRDGPLLVIPGWPLVATDSIVRAFTSTSTEGVRVTGYVNRATATSA